MRRRCFASPLGVCLWLLSACTSTANVQVRVLEPAVYDLGRHPLVAMDRCEGEGAEAFATAIVEALRAARDPVTGAAALELLDRRDLDRMLDDIRRRGGSDVDPDSVELLRRWQQAEVLVRCRVLDDGVTTDDVAEDQVDQRTGETHRLFRRTAHARVGLQVEVLTGTDARLLVRETFRGEVVRETTALDTEPSAIATAPLLDEARATALQRFLAHFLPHEEVVTAVLQADDELPDLQAGNGFAANELWAEAERSYRSAAQAAVGDLSSLRWKALHNLGVACTFLAQFDAARQALSDAYALAQDAGSMQMLQLSIRRKEAAERLRREDRPPLAPR